jgi:endonuclease/exonuclease/phosphatase family metal-dependent hydrolase
VIIAGDFNDWNERLDAVLEPQGLQRALPPSGDVVLTFPSRVPVFALDRVYVRGLECRASFAPRGTAWARMSDHLPLVVELEPL